MPRDKTASHEKIVATAFAEFLKYGFKDASMRRIAAACNMSASGLYKHFPSKEDMFAALVEPVYNDLVNNFFASMEEDNQTKPLASYEDVWNNTGENEMAIRYIYEHLDAFKLLVCHSQGTRYENFIQDLATLEEQSTMHYMARLKELGIPYRMIPEKEFRLFVNSNLTALFQVVQYDFTQEEALSYAKHMDQFYVYGWKKLLSIE
ncbi:MAG: TetR/AcrR family transcriptional regulator [Lachnospiraceae bacterium]|nr:TetR/AcrR family transcriptional regulator [Lachnospiraceae bacterium]